MARRNSVISRTSISIHAPSQLAVLPSLIHPQSRTPSSRPRHRHHPTHLLILLITISCLFSSTSASPTPSLYIPESMIEDYSGDVQVQPDRLAQKGRILVDPRPPPIPNPKDWTLATVDELQRRAFDDLSLLSPSPAKIHLEGRNALSSTSTSHISSSSGSTSTMITTARSSSATSTGTKTTSSSAIATSTQASVPLPSPFDQGFSGNITESCSNFMNGFLNNATFKTCLPFSLLLQSSNSFFQASKSITTMTQTLDYTCAAPQSICAPYLANLATNITIAANCASDLSSQNPLIQQAHLGLLAYPVLFTASCLRNPSTSAYCFADAVTNASSPTDSYIYYLPLNNTLPGGSQPSCGSCLQNTMKVFDAATSDRSSAISDDYVSAATQINVQCGPGFVNASLAAAVVSAGGSVHHGGYDAGGMGALALAVLVGSWLL